MAVPECANKDTYNIANVVLVDVTSRTNLGTELAHAHAAADQLERYK
jgi:hypothetical protein